MSHVIVPLDGSELAERALPLAASLAELSGSELRLVSAVVSPASLEAAMGLEALLDGGRDYLDEQAAAVRRRYGLGVTARADIATPVQLILGEAARPDVAAVVMSTHGRSGLRRLLLGSVAEGVLRGSPIPVYLLPAGSSPLPERHHIRRVLVPLDGSALSYAVMAPVSELASRSGAEVALLRVFEEREHLSRAPGQPVMAAVEHQLDHLEYIAHGYFGPVKAHLRERGVMATAEWALGTPAMEILASAERLHSDLIALATHGRSGLGRLRYGSVAESVLRHSKVPVMTFGPEALKRLARDVGAIADARLASPVSA